MDNQKTIEEKWNESGIKIYTEEEIKELLEKRKQTKENNEERE